MRFSFFGPRLGGLRPGLSFGEQEPRSRYYRPPARDDDHKPRWTTMILTVPLALLALAGAALCFSVAGVIAYALIKVVTG